MDTADWQDNDPVLSEFRTEEVLDDSFIVCAFDDKDCARELDKLRAANARLPCLPGELTQDIGGDYVCLCCVLLRVPGDKDVFDLAAGKLQEGQGVGGDNKIGTFSPTSPASQRATSSCARG